MNILKKSCVSSKLLLLILLPAVMHFLAAHALSADIVSLNVYEGYRFSDRTVVRSGKSDGADISFFVNMGRQNAASFALAALGAKKIREFGKVKPDIRDISPQKVNAWKKYANAPSPGYYVVQGADGRSLYLINVISFKNQGKAASYWKLTFSWEKMNE